MSFKASEISVGAFKDALALYPAAAPDKLKPLDTQRYDTIPKTLMERKGQGDAYLEKEEVEKLVEWKLKHGTFRPKLLQLVQSNPSDLIKKTSRKAFSTLQEDTSSSLKVLTSLKGIGPATASLLLSAADPDRVPFFSDELFRWVMWNEAGSPGGWKRIIKYNVKEYAVIVESVGKIVERLGVRAVECEKVAWVLGHEQKDIGKGFSVEVKKGSVEDKGKEAQEEEQKADEKKVKRGVKRKGEGAGQAPSEGIRRSIRRKFGT